VSRGSDKPLTSLPTSPDISFSPLLPSPSPRPSQQKVKKPSVLVPVSLSSNASSASSASSASKPPPLSQPSTIFSLTPTIFSSTSSTTSVPSPYVAPIKKINTPQLPVLPDLGVLPTLPDVSDEIVPPPPPLLPGAAAAATESSPTSSLSSFGTPVAFTPKLKATPKATPKAEESEAEASPIESLSRPSSPASISEKEETPEKPEIQEKLEIQEQKQPLPPPPPPSSSSSSSSSSAATPGDVPITDPISPSPSPPTPGDETIMQAIEDESFLYPTLDDPEFNIKIAEKREFADTTYDGKVYDSMQKIKEYANKMCNADFELSPHQLFVRNFLSIQTPYNSLLLYHGLGTGKTCSAITICEEMRDYLVNIGMSSAKKIIIVASPNVQQNFKLQLFDSRKLKLIDGVWNIRSCTGNKYLKEINPMNMKGMDEEKVVKEIKKIIKNSYMFLGYDQFASLIQKTSAIDDSIEDKVQRYKLMNQKLKVVFGNSLIVIDEFHNIRNTSDNSTNRAVANELQKLVKFGPSLLTRLLLLSGTPMYNSYREIIWLLNVMRLNDGRATIQYRDVFNDNPDDGIFVESIDENGTMTETGRDNLRRFSTGYVSYIRGENPYTFPYRIYPDEFAPMHTFAGVEETREAIEEGEAREPEKKNKIPNPRNSNQRNYDSNP
jgi:hypothetical protein